MSASIALLHAVKRFPGNERIGRGITAVAKLLGMREDVLQKKLSPTCDSHVLTLDEAEEITDLIGDPAAAVAFARTAGMACVPLPKPAEAGLLYRGASEVAKEFSEFFDAFQDATRDNQITPSEAERLQAEFAQLIVAGSGLLAQMHAMAATRAPVIPLHGSNAA